MHTDTIMKDIWLCLVRDFRTVYGKDLLRSQENALRSSMDLFRKVEFPGVMQAPPHLHKVVYQMQNLLKRYKFQNDAYSPEELEIKANREFVDYQKVLNTRPRYKRSTLKVLRLAQKLVAQVLGEFCPEEHLTSCAFGKRAAKEVPGKEGFLDKKVATLSGSADHIKWFQEKVLTKDPILLSATEQCAAYEIQSPQRQFVECDALTLVNVDKSWKTLRSIMPNTVIGGFYTDGIRRMLEKRFAEYFGVSLGKLPDRHKYLARVASIPEKESKRQPLVTLDLSKASDSYTALLVRILTGRDWYDALRFGRIGCVTVDGEKHHLNSFMAMGIGYTFPLQTILFRCLIQSISTLLGVKGIISVFGDDCIYPKKIHKHVLAVFADLGFLPNQDKTFCDHAFRESCGGDYYRGVPVRPYSPDFSSQDLRGTRLDATIYKIINGLLRRWTHAEIPRTIHYLMRIISQTDNLVFQVPPSFPDYAGVKVDVPRYKEETEKLIPWSPVWWDKDLQCPKFRHLLETPAKRIVRIYYPFYWDVLRSSSSDEELVEIRWEPSDNEPSISWISLPSGRKFYRSRIDGKRLERLIGVNPSKIRTTTKTRVSSSSAWAQDTGFIL